MTIEEAIRSGKHFRRKGWEEWLMVDPVYGHIYYEPKNRASEYGRAWRFPNSKDILTTDWEIRLEGRIVTEADKLREVGSGATYTEKLDPTPGFGPVLPVTTAKEGK